MLALPVLAAFGMHDLCRKLVVIFLSSGFDACVIPDTFLQDPSKYFSSTPWAGYHSTFTRGIYDLNPMRSLKTPIIEIPDGYSRLFSFECSVKITL